jgi:hypothetical protein
MIPAFGLALQGRSKTAPGDRQGSSRDGSLPLPRLFCYQKIYTAPVTQNTQNNKLDDPLLNSQLNSKQHFLYRDVLKY